MINKEKVKHIAKLARLELTANEIERYQKELSKILDYIEKLKKVKIDNVKPTSHSVVIENVWRKDEISLVRLQSSKLLKLSPQTKEGYFKVKKII